MDLAEKIVQLRTARGLNQSDLAEQLGVSRQSVSKWETGQSVPELDKLVALADLFGLTLDELVRGEAVPPAAEAPADEPTEEPADNPYLQPNAASVATAAEQGSSVSAVQRNIGYILLAVGLLAMVLGLLFGSTLLVIGLYLVLCGGVLLAVRRYALLLIAFLTVVPLMLLGPRYFRFGVYWQLLNLGCLLLLFAVAVHYIRKYW